MRGPVSRPRTATRTTDPVRLEVVGKLQAIHEKHRADVPRRNRETATVLRNFQETLKRDPDHTQAAKLSAEVGAVLAVLERNGLLSEEMVVWLERRLTSDRVKPGVDLVVRLVGEGWPVAVGTSMHLYYGSLKEMQQAIDSGTALSDRVTSIIWNQRGLLDWVPDPLRQSVEVLHVDFVDGDEEDESVRANDALAERHNQPREEEPIPDRSLRSKTEPLPFKLGEFRPMMARNTATPAWLLGALDRMGPDEERKYWAAHRAQSLSTVDQENDAMSAPPAKAAMLPWLTTVLEELEAEEDQELQRAHAEGDPVAQKVVSALELDQYYRSIRPAGGDKEEKTERLMAAALLMLLYPYFQFEYTTKLIDNRRVVDPSLVTREMASESLQQEFTHRLMTSARGHLRHNTVEGRLAIMHCFPKKVFTAKWVKKVLSGEMMHEVLVEIAREKGDQYLHMAAALTVAVADIPRRW